MTGFRIRQLHRFGTCLYLINKKNKKEAKEKAVCEAFRKLLSFFENYLKIGIQRMICQLLFRIRANDKSQNQKNPP